MHLGYNSGRMIEKLGSVLESLCCLDINEPVLAGVSGGADSLCLMDSLAQAGYRLTVAHLNYGLRPEADLEAERVSRHDIEMAAGNLAFKISCFVRNYGILPGIQQISFPRRCGRI